MGLTREQRIIKQILPQVQKFTPIATDMFLPNHSGDHTAGRTKTPTQDTQIANKKYVDDITSPMSTQINILQDNLILTNFRLQMASSLAYGKFENGWIDEFENETGVDTTNSTNELYNSTDDYYSPSYTGGGTTPYIHYKMNDNDATTDIIDNISSVNATNQQNTEDVTTTGKINSALSFNGSTDYASIPYDSVFSSNTMSVSLWIKRKQNISDVHTLIFGDWLGAGSDISISSPSSGGGFVYDHLYFVWYASGAWNGLKSTETTSNLLPLNEWVLLSVVRASDGKPANAKMFINGAQITTTTQGTAAPASINTGAYIAGSVAYTNCLECDIDDVRIYDYALSDSDINDIYNGGDGTEDDGGGAIVYDNMTLISNAQTAENAPSSSRIVLLQEDVDSITLNTDLKAYASRDGTNYTQITLSDVGDFDTGKKILVGESTFSSASGTSIKWKLVTDNNKNLKIHGVGLLWE